MLRDITWSFAGAGLGLAAIVTLTQPTHALTMKECSAKYQAEKSAGTLKGMTWQDFRRSECGPQATSGAGGAAMSPGTTAPSAPKSAVGPATFPNAISPKYTGESPGIGRMRTCLDQYRANKVSNSNGGLRWIQKGGGYWSECSKHLKS